MVSLGPNELGQGKQYTNEAFLWGSFSLCWDNTSIRHISKSNLEGPYYVHQVVASLFNNLLDKVKFLEKKLLVLLCKVLIALST